MVSGVAFKNTSSNRRTSAPSRVGSTTDGPAVDVMLVAAPAAAPKSSRGVLLRLLILRTRSQLDKRVWKSIIIWKNVPSSWTFSIIANHDAPSCLNLSMPARIASASCGRVSVRTSPSIGIGQMVKAPPLQKLRGSPSTERASSQNTTIARPADDVGSTFAARAWRRCAQSASCVVSQSAFDKRLPANFFLFPSSPFAVAAALNACRS
mmetsp:Transcript_57552/g.160247  ORF Transcript_57552/g.160247 Transcript_57552/m.160247 type:complete len:208 (-) Transcript_57552:781-1404(-)